MGLQPTKDDQRLGETLPSIVYLSSPLKKAFYLVGDTPRELSFLEAADIFHAEPDEKAVPFGDSIQRHYEQVQSAIRQYSLDQQREYQEDKLKIGSKDNDAKKAAAFLREVRPLLDEEGRGTIDRLKQMVERGAFNQLSDALNRISRKQKKEPAPLIKIQKQLEEMKKLLEDLQSKKEKDKTDQIIAYARHLNGKTLLVVANKNVNRPVACTIKVPTLKAEQKLENLLPSYGQKSIIQAREGEIGVNLGPARVHVFEINTPNIENYSNKIYKQNI